MTRAEYRRVAIDEIAGRLLPINQVEVGKGETAIPAKH